MVQVEIDRSREKLTLTRERYRLLRSFDLLFIRAPLNSRGTISARIEGSANERRSR